MVSASVVVERSRGNRTPNPYPWVLECPWLIWRADLPVLVRDIVARWLLHDVSFEDRLAGSGSRPADRSCLVCQAEPNVAHSAGRIVAGCLIFGREE
jgi:hypothetical protein